MPKLDPYQLVHPLINAACGARGDPEIQESNDFG
jgi:hypothetical protein